MQRWRRVWPAEPILYAPVYHQNLYFPKIVGLPDTAVQESKERVGAVIKNSGGYFPNQRITVNLAPADLRKEGPPFDLPIAVGIMAASQLIWPDLEPCIFLGELSLMARSPHARGAADDQRGAGAGLRNAHAP